MARSKTRRLWIDIVRQRIEPKWLRKTDAVYVMAVRGSARQCEAVPGSARQCKAVQSSARQCQAAQGSAGNARQCKA
eukprot:11013612-Lingulodinium_polyedra.AAC.1